MKNQKMSDVNSTQKRLGCLFKSFILFSLLSASQSSSSQETDAELMLQAQMLAQKFAETLKPQLKSALQAGGPVAAIEVCSEQAPAIAKALSVESGWQVKRVSLKPRNKNTATADDWERGVLQQFEQRQSQATPGSALVVQKKVAGSYRWMKAQITEPLCLACHGTQLAPEVSSTLEKLYPADLATGYDLGQVRGAISLRKTLDAGHLN